MSCDNGKGLAMYVTYTIILSEVRFVFAHTHTNTQDVYINSQLYESHLFKKTGQIMPYLKINLIWFYILILWVHPVIHCGTVLQ